MFEENKKKHRKQRTSAQRRRVPEKKGGEVIRKKKELTEREREAIESYKRGWGFRELEWNSLRGGFIPGKEKMKNRNRGGLCFSGAKQREGEPYS